MKKSIVYTLLICPMMLFSQCSITSIQFQAPTACNELSSRYAIPVTVTYQNNVETVELRCSGLDYEFGKKRLKNNHHSTSTQNQFTFIIYDYADGLTNDIWVYVDMYGSDCTAIVRDSANYTLTYSECPIITGGGGGIDPEPYICFDSLILSGTVTQDSGYFASNYIKSTQVFESGTTDTIGATNFVQLKAGFHAKAGSNLLINNSGCSPQNQGNGGGNGVVGIDCPKVLYLSSPVSNTREYSADSLIVTNQNIFPTGNVTYNSPLIQYGNNYNAQSGATVQHNKNTSCN